MNKSDDRGCVIREDTSYDAKGRPGSSDVMYGRTLWDILITFRNLLVCSVALELVISHIDVGKFVSDLRDVVGWLGFP